MNSRHLQVFERFAKGKRALPKQTHLDCVIYTRVSSKEQADNNLSLETQLKYCLAYALSKGFNIVGQFGGTYESAKNDERKEFNRMMAFVRRNRKSIGHIIIYSLDRFSRSGPNAIYIAEGLKKQGVTLMSATQPSDSNTSSGNLQQNIQFVFSQYENDNRRDKCMAGTKEKLLRGFWSGQAPMGYDQYSKGKEQYISVNDTGKLIRKAFEWKVEMNLDNHEIITRLATMGLKLNRQRLSDIFRNPFYCGIIVNKALEGQVVEGRHEKLVSREMFLKANHIVVSRQHKGSHVANDPNIPLKRFLKCDLCRSSFVGYEVKKKRLHYYKCTKVGCRCNRSAKAINQEFIDILKNKGVQKELSPIVTDLAIEAISYRDSISFGDSELVNRQMRQVEKKMETLQEKYILDEVERELYGKFIQKYQTELTLLHDEQERITSKLSAHYRVVRKITKMSQSLATMWCLSDFRGKEALQYLVFPDGLRYNTREKAFRMASVNMVFVTNV